MGRNDVIIKKFSSHLFWDVRREELDSEKDKAFIIKRALEYGLWEDWLLIKKVYGLETITDASLTFRELDPKTLAFIANVSGVPKEKFRCYTMRQLTPRHWRF